MSHHASVMHLADDVMFPEFVLNVLLLCSHSSPSTCSLLWDVGMSLECTATRQTDTHATESITSESTC